MLRVVYAILVITAIGAVGHAMAEPYSDSVTFVRVSEFEDAVEMVRNGTIDMYFFGVPHHLVEVPDGLKVYTAHAGGTVSLLLNPAEGDTFNLFTLQPARFAVNYLLDREMMVEELLDGYGSSMLSPYTQFDPDYLDTIEEVESFGIHYDPELARYLIHESLSDAGAVLTDGIWYINDEPVVLKLFIRHDDPIRHSIGESLAVQLEDMGLTIERVYGDLRQAYATVYGADPADFGWHVYTEGWGGSLSRSDDTRVAAFYAPWRAAMPGYGNSEFWNYENEKIDEITRTLYHGEYVNGTERADLLSEAVGLGIEESVRVFVFAKSDTYAVNENVDGVVSHVAAGIANRYTPVNAQAESPDLKIGVLHLAQSAWNPVGGLGDVYSLDIVSLIHDPSGVSNPYTLDPIPLRVEREVVAVAPEDALEVPADAIQWDPYEQAWTPVGSGTNATTLVTQNYTFSNWHHGAMMDMNDILYSVYFLHEWGTDTGEGDTTVDPGYTLAIAPFLHIFKGVQVVDSDTFENYSDLGEGAGVFWAGTPWEIHFAMDQMVQDGIAAYSATHARVTNSTWLSLIDPDTAQIVKQYLESFIEDEQIPAPFQDFDMEWEYYAERYQAAIDWIDTYGHGYVGNGPFYLTNFDREGGMVTLEAFDDPTYPYEQGVWSEFGAPLFPTIASVSTPVLNLGEEYTINVFSQYTSKVLYFVSHPGGASYSGAIDGVGFFPIHLTAEETENLGCPVSLRVFAYSDVTLVPDVYSETLSVGDC